MKTYEVLFDPHAQEEALDAAHYIARFSPRNAAKWYSGLEKVLDSLTTMPARCSRARESETLGVEVRQYIYHSHRIIFRIEERAGIVRILHIRHAAQRAIDEPNEELNP